MCALYEEPEWATALHAFADGAVILAVVFAIYELLSHRNERRELTTAIDDHIRVLAVNRYRIRGAPGFADGSTGGKRRGESLL
jgi:hypothetical protein